MTHDMSTGRRKLGRGLTALLSQPVVAEAIEPKSPPESAVSGGGESGVDLISVDSITPSPFQPRRAFDAEELAALAESIRRDGLLQPIVVRRTPAGTHELIAGERRWRAAKIAGLTKLPAVMRDVDDETAAGLALIENIQRTDLNPIERGDALKQLQDKFGLTQQQIAERVGLDRASVANLIRITDLEPEIRALVSAGKLGLGHAKALLSIERGDARLRAAGRCADEGWTTRRVELEARRVAEVKRPSKPDQGPDIARLERRLTEHLGARVSLILASDGQRGELRIAFTGLDHFDGVLEKFGFRGDDL